MISKPNSVTPSGDQESFTVLFEAGQPLQNFSGQDLSNRDFNHRDLAGTLFNGSDLSHAKLNGVNLQDAQLCGANLTEAKLCGAQLPAAKLNGADLGRANLTGADLTGADLRRADFSRAELRDAHFSNANVQGANFSGSSGLSEDTKLDLKNRGATFRRSAHSPEVKWWVRFFVVPIAVALIGSGGFFFGRQSNSPAQISPSAPVEKP